MIFDLNQYMDLRECLETCVDHPDVSIQFHHLVSQLMLLHDSFNFLCAIYSHLVFPQLKYVYCLFCSDSWHIVRAIKICTKLHLFVRYLILLIQIMSLVQHLPQQLQHKTVVDRVSYGELGSVAIPLHMHLGCPHRSHLQSIV